MINTEKMYTLFLQCRIDNLPRNNANVLRHELKGFEAPEFMLKKMRTAINQEKTFINCQSPALASANTVIGNTSSGVEAVTTERTTQQVNFYLLIVSKVSEMSKCRIDFPKMPSSLYISFQI